jgi:hypothetical protein
MMLILSQTTMRMKAMMNPQRSRHQAKFKITGSERRKSKMKGVIVYNFVISR